MEVLAVEVDGAAGEQRAEDREELVGAAIPLVVIGEVPERPLLDRITAGDDVEGEASAADPLERRRLLRQHRGQHQ